MQSADARSDYNTHRHSTTLASTGSAVSWGAVIAGAVVGAALTGMLITAGSGLGFLAVSPWQGDGASGTALVTGSIIWLFVSQVIAYGIAGYMTGRLRTKWQDVQRDESFFRDTAHGFLVWALSFVVGLVLLGSTASSVISGTAKAGGAMAGASAGVVASMAGAVQDDADGGVSLDYFADMLLRPKEPGAYSNQGDARREVASIFTRSVAQGEIATEDQDYLIKLVAQQAGLSEDEARNRLETIHAKAVQTLKDIEVKAREAADAARKAAAVLALWVFASMLLGAFVCSLAATVGGRARDQ